MGPEGRGQDRHKQTCTQIREDGAYIEAGENDNLLVQRVSENEGAVGVLGYSFLEENGERVRGIPIGGITPTAATIADFTYPGARKLYIYVKGEHLGVIPGLREFLTAWTQGWGPGGYLTQHGLIPLPDAERAPPSRRCRIRGRLPLPISSELRYGAPAARPGVPASSWKP